MATGSGGGGEGQDAAKEEWRVGDYRVRIYCYGCYCLIFRNAITTASGCGTAAHLVWRIIYAASEGEERTVC